MDDFFLFLVQKIIRTLMMTYWLQIETTFIFLNTIIEIGRFETDGDNDFRLQETSSFFSDD